MSQPIVHVHSAARAPEDPLLMLTEHRPGAAAGVPADDRLLLPFEHREKARQRARLESGREAGLQLPRGTVLRGGDRLCSASGVVVLVVAAPEAVSTVCAASARALARVAYHLGNRHVALEVGDGWVRYVHDHVLDAMVEGLGFDVVHEHAPFEPEGGAYQSTHRHRPTRSHRHSDGHDHDHEHEHDHKHAHERA